MSTEFGVCYAARHKSRPNRDRIPIDNLRKIPGDPLSDILKYCIECRTYQRFHNNNSATRKRERIEKNHEEGYRYCIGNLHNHHSEHPKERVPIELFTKEHDNPNNPLSKKCADCRRACNEEAKRCSRERKARAESKGMFCCQYCQMNKPIDQMARKKNGRLSVLCLECQKHARGRTLLLRRTRNNIKLGMIMQHKRNCLKCHNIFLKPEEGSLGVTILKSYEKDSEWFVDWGGEVHSVEKFLITHQDKLELSAIEFDHIPEKELRAAGLLKEGEAYNPKSGVVGGMSSERKMKIEAAKCRHLCCLCHNIETIRREKGLGPKCRTDLMWAKFDYADGLKSQGCSSCGRKYDVLRAVEFDHIDPKTKSFNVSAMMYHSKYSLEQVKEEIAKCRVLCRFCHRIQTKRQHESGIL